MKIQILIASVAYMVLLSCGGSNNSSGESGAKGSEQSYDGWFDGTIRGTSDGSFGIARAFIISRLQRYELDEAQVVNGQFTLKLPEIPESRLLPWRDISFIRNYMTTGLTAVPDEVKLITPMFCGDHMLSSLNYTDRNNVTKVRFTYLYADRDATITGTQTNPFAGVKIYYEMHLKKGWNVVHFKDLSGWEEDLYCTGPEPDNIVWWL